MPSVKFRVVRETVIEIDIGGEKCRPAALMGRLVRGLAACVMYWLPLLFGPSP